MTVLNQADAIYLGDQPVDAVYLGAEKVWPAVPTMTYDQAVLADEPLAYYRFNDDLGSNVAADSTPNAHHATYGGITQRGIAGPVGSAIGFPVAPGQPVTLPSTLVLPQNSPVTVEYWRRTTAADQAAFTIGNQTGTTNRCSGHDPFTDNAIYWDYGSPTLGEGRVGWNGMAPLADNNTWFHVALTAGGGTQAIYINGVQRAVNNTHVPPTIVLWAGLVGSFTPGTTFARGALAEFAVYTKALTAQQIAAHYAAAHA